MRVAPQDVWSAITHAGRLGQVAAAGLPELDVTRVRLWSERLIPAEARDQLRVEVDVAPRHLTIVECRPPWDDDVGQGWTRFPIARLRYTKTAGVWTLYWRDSNERFLEYDLIPPSPHISDLLDELDRDPTAIFWG